VGIRRGHHLAKNEKDIASRRRCRCRSSERRREPDFEKRRREQPC